VFNRRRFLIQLAAALCCAVGAEAQTPGKSRLATPPPEERVDINHASIEELLKLPGMTRSWAGRIVRFRPCRAKNDLLDRGVVPSEV
jgi:DNA uptake protein ComE-like DNA-binding protein